MCCRKQLAILQATLLLTYLMGTVSLHCSAEENSESKSAMQEFLESRVEADPGNASMWRALGQFHVKAKSYDVAKLSFSQAVKLDPENAAAHFGLADCQLALGQTDEAIVHLDLTIQLAPQSAYARTARQHLAQLLPANQVAQVDYEVKSFDGSKIVDRLVNDQIESIVDPASRWIIQLEFGALYNSNVALTPASRDFANATRPSAQGMFNPYLEYDILVSDAWSSGPTFDGFFSINENDVLGALNLQSYKPGFYLERFVEASSSIIAWRLQYDYTLDEFDGITFANRHALTPSLTSIWDSGNTSVLYWTTDITNFNDDGIDPATSSRDGTTHTLGASQTWAVNHWLATSLTAGADLQWADTQGSDFRYFGGTLYVGWEKLLSKSITLDTEAGWGNRDYYDADITPSRNENIWRGSARLRKQWTKNWSTSAVFNFDRFGSANDLFRAERVIGGVMSKLEF